MRYVLKVLRGGSDLSELTLDATDADDAQGQALGLGYTVIGIKGQVDWLSWQRKGRRRFPLALFCQELMALLDAGLSLMESLETLAEKESRPDVRNILVRVIAHLRDGHPFSYALQHSESDFPDLFIATVRASEKTGALVEALARYVTYQTQMDAVRRQVVSASIYPAMLGLVGGLVTLFLMTYVVPRFSHIYADMGGDLPLMSRMLMRWGLLLETHGTAILAGVILSGTVLIYLLTRQERKRWLVSQLWRLPGIGARLHVYQLARFYRSLGMLLRGGMPLLTSLKMVSELLESTLRGQLAHATASIREGHAMSHAMAENGLTTPVALRMLRVGERTGRMGEMMERTASFYEDETARWVDRFSKLFEPILMAFIGVVIGVIVVLMYIPIFELAGSIK